MVKTRSLVVHLSKTIRVLSLSLLLIKTKVSVNIQHFDALVQVLEGEDEFIIGRETNLVSKGQLILMPANIPHTLKANTCFKMP